MSAAIEFKRVRLKYQAQVEMGQSPSSSEYSDSSDGCLPFLQGTADFGVITPTPQVYCASPSKIALAGDTLFSVRAPVGELNIANRDVGIGRGLCAVRAGKELSDRFAWWALHEARNQLNYVSTGSTYEAVSVEDVRNIQIVKQSNSIQLSIADYLDRETSRINNLISAKERWLEILAEKRTAVITNAVTRGLNPKVPLRDSGIPWLGKIPKQWEIKRSKWLFTERDERSTTGEEDLLSLRMEKGLVPHNDVSNKPTSPEELIGYKKTSVGEIVINRMRASSGLIALTPQDGLVSPDYAVYCPDKNIDPLYYTYLFTTELLQKLFRSESTGLGTGSSGFLRLYSDKFLSFWFPVPPIDEQQRIVDHIARETTKIDTLRTATEKTIALLKERRSALISAVVTGTITVEEICP